MNEETIAALIGLSGIIDEGRRDRVRTALRALPQSAGTAMRAHHDGIIRLLNDKSDGQRMGVMFQWIKFMNEATDFGETHTARALFLSNWFDLFRTRRSFKIDQPIKFERDHMDYFSLSTTIKDIPASEMVKVVRELTAIRPTLGADFLTYCQTVPDAPVEVARMRERMIGNGMGVAHVAQVIHLFHQNHLELRALSEKSCVDLWQFLRVCPPADAWGGFTVWGPGDQGKVDDNITEHFLKHVVNGGNATLTVLTECPVWWAALGLTCCRADLQPLVSVPQMAQLTGFFPADDAAPILTAQIPGLVGKMREIAAFSQPVKDFFCNHQVGGAGPKCRERYRDLALVMGKNLTDIAIFVAGSKVYISGRYDGHGSTFYLIGRLGTGGVLGLSSAYVVHDIDAKLRARDPIAWRPHH